MKTCMLWCSTGAICLAACVQAFAAEGPYAPPQEIRAQQGFRPALPDANPRHKADTARYREYSAVLDNELADSIRQIDAMVPVDISVSSGTTPLMPQALAHTSAPAPRTSTHALQGLFCNSADQVDETVTHMRKGLSTRAAVDLVNREAVVCTFADLIRYIIDRPVAIKEIPGTFPLFKYEGTLVAVVVGGAIRPVTPPVQIFFAIPEKLGDAPREGRA